MHRQCSYSYIVSMVQMRFKQFFKSETRCIVFAIVVGLLVECLFVAMGWSHFRPVEVVSNIITSVIIGSVSYALRKASSSTTGDSNGRSIQF